MTAPALDARLHAEAIKAAIKVQFGPWDAYDYGEVPGSDDNAGSLPYIFAVVSIERVYVPVRNLTARPTRSSWRAAVRYTGRTVDESRWAEWKVATALGETTLTIDGHTSTPLQFEPGDAITKDGDRYSGWAFWDYVL